MLNDPNGQAPKSSGSTNDWMTTYSDMVTLLFAFFVLLFAISQVDVQKFNMLVAALSSSGASPEVIMEIGERYGTSEVDPNLDLNDPKVRVENEQANAAGGAGSVQISESLREVYDQLNSYIEQQQMSDAITLDMGEDYVFIRFMDGILFDPNSSQIRASNLELINFIGQWLKAAENDIELIRIDGHTASVPGYDDYPVSDRKLSSDRANAILMYFEDTIGIQPEKLAAFSLGRYKPIADNNTEEGRAKNRRIEILVSTSNFIDGHLENIYEKLVD